MTGISLDLRQRIVEAYEQKEGSMRCIGKRFKVGKNTVLRLTKQKKETGDITPKAKGGSKPKQTTVEKQILISKILSEQNDATLCELCDLMATETGEPISISSMHRLILKIGWTRKKKLCTRQNKNSQK
jgi:transposase